MRNSFLCFILLALILPIFQLALAVPSIEIGLILDGPWEGNARLVQHIRDETLDLTRGEFDVRFPSDKTIQANWSIKQIKAAITTLQNDAEIDLIITPGIMASHLICHHTPLTKPVIAPFILDAGWQNLPIKNGTSGIPNLNYIFMPQMIEQELLIFQEILDFKQVAILIDEILITSMNGFETQLVANLEPMQIKPQIVKAGTSATTLLNAIQPETEAVYILPVPQINFEEYEKLIQGLIEKKVASFSYLGAEDVNRGILAGLHKDLIGRISRRVALNVQRIILGEKPESIPVSITLDNQLTINDATARAIGVYPSWAVMTEATLVGREEVKTRQRWTLNNAVQEAVTVNLDLAAQQYSVAAGRQNINEARANLWPMIDASGNYVIIDKDRAQNSMGQMAERTLTGTLTATQVIFSEPIWANLSIQKKVQKTRESELDQLKLDIMQQTANAYLNVLGAKTYERIQQENLKVSRKNLELARVRELIGSAGPAEVYRWESEIASNRKSVIEANSQRNLAEIQLNRLLHRPAEESFATAEVSLNAPSLITSRRDLTRYIDNKQAFRTFRDFMVQEALKNSPELIALKAAIAAQKRVLSSATHRFWSPTLAIQGQMNYTFSRAGEGIDAGFDLPPTLPFTLEFPEPKDRSWSVGLNLSFPIFTGGEKFAARQKALLEVEQLNTQHKSITDKIEQRIRSALHVGGASFASIKQSKLAADAARKSLNVVQDAYSQGLVSIVELLDAQRTALITDEMAATSIYNFLIDLMEIQRAYGKFTFLSTPEKIDQFFQRVDAYFEKMGVQVD